MNIDKLHQIDIEHIQIYNDMTDEAKDAANCVVNYDSYNFENNNRLYDCILQLIVYFKNDTDHLEFILETYNIMDMGNVCVSELFTNVKDNKTFDLYKRFNLYAFDNYITSDMMLLADQFDYMYEIGLLVTYHENNSENNSENESENYTTERDYYNDLQAELDHADEDDVYNESEKYDY